MSASESGLTPLQRSPLFAGGLRDLLEGSSFASPSAPSSATEAPPPSSSGAQQPPSSHRRLALMDDAENAR